MEKQYKKACFTKIADKTDIYKDVKFYNITFLRIRYQKNAYFYYDNGPFKLRDHLQNIA